MTNPYPITREAREEAVFRGDGSATYGPFDLMIFDDEDIEVWTRADDAPVWVEASPAVVKTSGEAFDTFSVVFPGPVNSSVRIKVLSRRVHERQTGVRSGTKIDPVALEKELSKIATALQELRRDAGKGVQVQFGDGYVLSDDLEDGDTFMKSGRHIVKGPNAANIAAAQGYAGAAEQSAGEAGDFAEEAANYAALARNDVLVETFIGNGSQLDFPLAADPGSRNNIWVNLNGVPQLRASYALVYLAGVPVLRFLEAPPNLLVLDVVYGSRIVVGAPGAKTVTYDKIQDVSAALRLLGRKAGSGGQVQEITPDELRDLFLPVGSVVQTVSAVPYTANANLSGNIPLDDTLPQIGEGTQILTLNITPKSTTNKLRARFAGVAVPTKVGPSDITWAIFNGGANAIRAGSVVSPDAGYPVTLAGEVEYVPGVLTQQTISVRVGANGASTNPVRMNGSAASRLFGGAQGATLIVDEIKG